MQKYRRNSASPVRVAYGVELQAGLRAFPETAPFAEDLGTLNAQLDARYEATRAAEKPLGVHRAELRIAELLFERATRTFARSVEAADGGRRGPLYTWLFPAGLNGVLSPAGTRQVPPARDLLGRVQRCPLPGAEALREEWLPQLEAAFKRLDLSIESYAAARATALEAFKDELAVRDEHELAVERIMGQVRATFPGDRVLQDTLFPRPKRSSSAPDDDDDDEPSGGAPVCG